MAKKVRKQNDLVFHWWITAGFAMNAPAWWFNSGQAAEAARSLVWFVVILFVVAGVALWREARSELKKEKERKVNDGL